MTEEKKTQDIPENEEIKPDAQVTEEAGEQEEAKEAETAETEAKETKKDKKSDKKLKAEIEELKKKLEPKQSVPMKQPHRC